MKTVVKNSLLSGTTFNNKSNVSSKAETPEEQYTNYINTSSSGKALNAVSAESSKAATDLSNLYSQLGFTFQNNANLYPFNDIIVKAPKTEKGKQGAQIQIFTNSKDKQTNIDELERLKGFMIANASKEKIEELTKKGLLETTETPGELD